MKIIRSVAFLLAVSLLSGALSYAEVGIKVISNKTFDAGEGGPAEKTQSFTVQNIGNEPAKVDIRATDSQDWTLSSSSPSINSYSLQFSSGNAWSPVTKTNSTIIPSLNGGETSSFNLRFQSPTDISDRTLTTTQVPTVKISASPIPAIPYWAKAYGGTGYERLSSVIHCSDGGLIAYGETTSSGAGDRDLLLMKLRSDGTIAWQKTYGFPLSDNFDQYLDSIMQCDDGGFVVAGNTRMSAEGHSHFWILKIDGYGTIQWQKVYDLGNSGSRPRSISKCSAGGFVVAGISPSDIWILRLNSDGSIVWQKTYGTPEKSDSANSIQETSDGGFIIAGDTSSFGFTGTTFWVLKIRNDGTIAWQKAYAGANYCYGARECSDGSIFVAGQADRGKILLLKLNTEGSIIWQKISDQYMEIVSLQETSDQCLLLCGGSADIFVCKLSLDGSFIWQRQFGGLSTERGHSAYECPDGGIIVSGETFSYGTGGDALIIKLSPEGLCPPLGSATTLLFQNANCIETITNCTVTVPNCTVIDTNCSVNDANVVVSEIVP